MIGLGSNRLTVCRRGGMSVTQAGLGGMEWLAGGRGPSWASPYSAQATAALKDAFTAAQWQTIRDYGFAHPEDVEIVNQVATSIYFAEDKYILYSFIDLGIIRGLVTDGSAYIQLQVRYNTHYTYELLFANTATGGWVFGGNVGIAGSGYGLAAAQWRNGDKYVIIPTLPTDYTKIVADKDGIKVGDNYYALPSQSSESQSDNIRLFWGSGSSASKIGKYGRYRIKDKTGVVILDLVPFIHENKNGLLDWLTGTFYQNAGSGSFTISETPAS